MTARSVRLAATATVATSGVGMAATAAGWMSGVDGTLVFPVAAVVGIAVLIHYHPRRSGRHPEG